MLGRTPTRNPVVPRGNGPIDWHVGTFDRGTGKWDSSRAKNVKWAAKLGTQTYGTPVVAGGQVYVGTNNGAGYLPRYPSNIDLGCLLCFRESDGEFLWQFSAEKLASGRVHDWPMQGMGGPPLVEGERMWIVSNRWEVLCLDTQGFRDGENDGPYRDERIQHASEADVVWKLDLIGQLGVHPHPAGMGPDRRCSIAAWGDRIYIVTGNGVDESHIRLPTPQAPSLVCLDKQSGKLLWTDSSPGENILNTQISSPLVAEIAGQVQVIVPQGDGWLRSFQAETGKLIWEFDLNEKTSKWFLGGRGTRNSILATPVLYEGRIYIASGQEAEHGEGPGRLVCIDPTRSGDISSELAVDSVGNRIPHRRLQAVDLAMGERAVANPNSGLVWEFAARGDKTEDNMHRTLSSVAVHQGLVIAADLSGFVHCLDAQTGKKHWGYDALAAIWSAPLVVGELVYIGDEDGDVAVFRLSADPRRAMEPLAAREILVDGEPVHLRPVSEILLGDAVYASPVFANGTLYIATRKTLYAISIEGIEGTEGEEQPHTDKTPRRSDTGAIQETAPANKSRVPRAAFVATPHDVVEEMLELAGVQAGQVVCDLGSGDGRIPITAARKYGARGIGYELDPELVIQSARQAEVEGVTDRVQFHERDLFEADLTQVDVIVLYLYPAQNRELVPRLKALRAGVRIITHHYALPGIEPEQTRSFVSQDSGETHTIYRYTTPLTVSSEGGSPAEPITP
jgi:outer membrane protein assembly factor BamB/predicted RNA methylase